MYEQCRIRGEISRLGQAEGLQSDIVRGKLEGSKVKVMSRNPKSSLALNCNINIYHEAFSLISKATCFLQRLPLQEFSKNEIKCAINLIRANDAWGRDENKASKLNYLRLKKVCFLALKSPVANLRH